MAKIFGLEIPDGLENLFARVLQLKPNGEVNGIGLTLPKTTYRKNTVLRGQSLFVGLESYWDSLNGTQKSGWTDYWESLDFSSHSGAGGWPGSGYSAFVYFNAPRVRDGLDIQLDPPAALGPDIIVNGGFDGTGYPWELNYDLPIFTWDDGIVYAEADEFDDGQVRQNVGAWQQEGDAQDWRLEFDMRIVVGAGGSLGFRATMDDSNGGEGYPTFFPESPAPFNGWVTFEPGDTGWLHYSTDAHLGTNDPSDSTGTLCFIFAAFEYSHQEVYLDNISLRQIL